MQFDNTAMRGVTYAALFCLLALGAFAQDEILEDARLPTIGLITKYGYPAETHSVTTSDGYILELHRIPYGVKPGAGPAPNKKVVFLQHGNLCSSADWVLMGPGKGFAYILADFGYDVWMGNSRGNTYSRRHQFLDPDSDDGDFWQFDWNEMGLYDLPAVIDYVIEQTEQPKIFYVGHSMGTSMFYVMASELPEYNDKIRAMFSLSPIAFMGFVVNPMLRTLAYADAMMGWYITQMGANEYEPTDEFAAEMGYEKCRDGAPNQDMCANILFLGAGFDSEQLNYTMMPVIMGHTPAGASSRQLWHFAQEVYSFRFQKFDWGVVKNLELYGQMIPPSYDLSKITCPMSLHFSDNDWFANTIDVDTFAEKLPNLIGKFRVPFDKFNHLDFLWAIDVKTLLYDKVVSLMARY